MRKHRFYINDNISLDSTITLDKENSHHIANVLKMRIDDIIYLINDSIYEYICKIIAIDKRKVQIQVKQEHNPNTESSLDISVAQVISKGQKMDLIIQKCTELAANSIIPIYSERSQVKIIPDREEKKVEHWHKIAVAASCQCWRTKIPKVLPPQDLESWLKSQSQDNTTKVILHPHTESPELKNLNVNNSISVLLGPEGGFTESEVNLAIANNFIPIKCGPRILRAETAAIVITAILQNIFGDS